MPLQYYDPMLYASTSANPNVMSVTVTLTEPVEGELLREAVEQCRVRFPYFYIRPRVEGNELIPVPNPLPVIVRGTWAPTLLCSRETNYHLMAFKYEGNRLAVEMVHSISDGAGLLPYLKSVLYVYLSQKCQTQYDPTGFRLPGQAIPDTEIGDPFPGIDVDSVEAPFYQKPPVADFYQLSNRHPVGRDHWQVYFLKLPEDQVIRYCRDNDGSPNVLISALLARAIRQADPDDERTITAGVAIDHKAMLGNSDNYRLFANIASVDFPKERSGDDILKTCTIARGQLMLQAQPENSLFYLKTKKMGFERMRRLPLQAKVDLINKALGMKRSTVAVSYANSRSFGPLDSCIREVYCLGEPTVSDILCEVACVNHSFFLAFSQAFESRDVLEAFLREMESAGISYEVMRTEPYRLSGVRYDDILDETTPLNI